MSSPAMSPDPKRRATIFQHRRSEVQLLDPCTGQSVDAAKTAQKKERTYAMASLLAGFDGVILRMATARERDHYLNAAGMAMDAAAGPRW